MTSDKHEIRLTFGDCLWESLIWHDDAHGYYQGVGDASSIFYERQHYRYAPHAELDYHYFVNSWFSAGVGVDFQYTAWHLNGYNNKNELSYSSKENFYNVCIIPAVRFTYFRSTYVNIYSSIGIGMTINGGTETDINGKNTAIGAAVDIRALGLAIGKDHWHGTLDVGGLTALRNKESIYMVCSKIIQLGVSYTF